MTATADTDPPFDERSLACAVGVLDQGREKVTPVAAVSDEELVALDGITAPQITALPFLEEHAPELADREPLARTAMRSLMVRRQVISEIEAAEFEERPLADDRLQRVVAEPLLAGALVLRRSSRDLVVFEREVSAGVHRLYYYPHDGGVVLEEEVTGDGVHMFTVMPRASVAERVRHLVDQSGAAGADGESDTVRTTDVEGHPDWGRRLADTRALTIGTSLSRMDDAVARVHFHMTSSEVIAGQMSDDDQEVTLVPVSAAGIEAIVADMFAGDEDAADGAHGETSAS